jgi:hypothetical protein
MEGEQAMNKNLSNRPKLVYLEDVLTNEEYGKFMVMLANDYPKVLESWQQNKKQNPEKWFREFEKEVRERFEEIMSHRIIEGEIRPKGRLMLYRNLIKEILGEI